MPRLSAKLLGNLLIGLSLGSALYVYWPLVSLELNYRLTTPGQVHAREPKSTDFGIVIDKLNINEAITANVDPFNKAEYLPVLHQNIAHAQTSNLPDRKGTTYLFSHSGDNPFSITRYNTSFYLLDKLNPGDEIKLHYQGQEYIYRVREQKVVKPQEVEFLAQNDRHQLVLQTCSPVGTSINRLLIFADPLD